MTPTPTDRLSEIRARVEKLATHIESLDSASPEAKTLRDLLALVAELQAEVADLKDRIDNDDRPARWP